MSVTSRPILAAAVRGFDPEASPQRHRYLLGMQEANALFALPLGVIPSVSSRPWQLVGAGCSCLIRRFYLSALLTVIRDALAYNVSEGW